jgi:hypothetical protein
VEHPDGSWTACNSWQALADLAKAVR